MRLYLVRHASAKSREEDPDRSLSDQGVKEVLKVAAFIELHTEMSVNSIYHSGKRRAEQTAEELGKKVSFVEGIDEIEGLKPNDDPGTRADKLRGEKRDLMLVGHLPYMSRLASLLLTGDSEKEIIRFDPATVVCLTGEGKDWQLELIINPRRLK